MNNILKNAFNKISKTIILVLFCWIIFGFSFAYDTNTGSFGPAETSLTGGIYKLITGTLGGILGTSSSVNYTMNTLAIYSSGENAPSITPVTPTDNAKDIGLNNDIVFDVTDNVEVVTGSIRVTLNGELIVSGGSTTAANIYNISLAAITDGYRVTCDIPQFAYITTINVEIYTADNETNYTIVSYSFVTQPDYLPPTTNTYYPEKSATLIPIDTEISFYISDKHSDVDTKNMELLINNINKIASCSITSTANNAVVGSALALDGNEDFVSFADSTDWDFDINTSWTAELWVYPRNISNSNIFSRSNDDALNGGENYLYYQSGLSWGAINSEWDTGLTLVTNQWQHIAVVYNAAEHKAYCYVNGTISTNVNVSSVGSSSGQFKIGDNFNTNFFDGFIDELCIYKNKALSAIEINNSYQRGLQHLANNNNNGLVAYWSFDNNANDESDKGHNGSFYGDATITGNAGWKVIYDPAKNFAYGTTINVTINAKNLTDVAMPPVSYWFKTYVDNIPPTTNLYYPVKFATNVPVNTDISFYISDKHTDVNTENIELLINNINKIASASLTLTANNAVVGSALALDGNEDFVSFADSTDWDFDIDTSWTAELWVYPRNISNSNIFSRSNDDTLTGGENYLYYQAGLSWGAINSEWDTGLTLATNQWQHIVVVYNAAEQKAYCYINGTISTNVNVSSVGSSSGQFKIGDNYNSSFFNGFIDELRIYKNKALSAIEINNSYQRGLQHLANNNNNGLVAYWSFDNNANDESGQGHNGSLNGNSSITGNAGWKVVYNPTNDFGYESTVNVTINAENITGIAMVPVSYWFTTELKYSIVFTNRTVDLETPPAYTGDPQIVVPGSKLIYSVGLKNESKITINNAVVQDLVPAHAHLYYTGAPPTINGNITNVVYQGITYNGGPDSLIKFKFDISPSPNGSATFNYTITID